MVFGDNIELSCELACGPNTIKKWIGGPGYKLLCYDGYSVDSSKYAIIVNDTIANFSMMIKKIAVEDTFCRYTCACGLHQYTYMLDLEGVDYICKFNVIYKDEPYHLFSVLHICSVNYRCLLGK